MLREACSKWFGQIRQNGWEKEGEREGAFWQELLQVCCRSCFLVSNIVIQHGSPNFRLALHQSNVFVASFLATACIVFIHFIWLLFVWLSGILPSVISGYSSINFKDLAMWIVFRNCCAQVLHGGDTLSAGRTAEFVRVGPCVVSVHV